MNNHTLAQKLMEELLGYLSEGSTIDATEEPLRVYLACYKVLERMEDPRSIQILDKAMQLLEAQVSKINHEQSRRTFIENVPWRRAIEQAWLDRKGKS
jgi:hypothetical protein